MNSIDFHGATHRFGAPVDWNEELNGPCDTLSVLVAELPSGAKSFSSVWVPTVEELELLNKGSGVVLTIIGTQPALAMGITEMPIDRLTTQN